MNVDGHLVKQDSARFSFEKAFWLWKFQFLHFQWFLRDRVRLPSVFLPILVVGRLSTERALHSFGKMVRYLHHPLAAPTVRTNGGWCVPNRDIHHCFSLFMYYVHANHRVFRTKKKGLNSFKYRSRAIVRDRRERQKLLRLATLFPLVVVKGVDVSNLARNPPPSRCSKEQGTD